MKAAKAYLWMYLFFRIYVQKSCVFICLLLFLSILSLKFYVLFSAVGAGKKSSAIITSNLDLSSNSSVFVCLYFYNIDS